MTSDLKTKLEQAQNGEIIELAPETYILDSVVIESKKLTIRGKEGNSKETIVEGSIKIFNRSNIHFENLTIIMLSSDLDHVLDIGASKVTLKNVNIINEEGVCIESRASTLNFVDSTIQNSSDLPALKADRTDAIGTTLLIDGGEFERSKLFLNGLKMTKELLLKEHSIASFNIVNIIRHDYFDDEISKRRIVVEDLSSININRIENETQIYNVMATESHVNIKEKYGKFRNLYNTDNVITNFEDYNQYEVDTEKISGKIFYYDHEKKHTLEKMIELMNDYDTLILNNGLYEMTNDVVIDKNITIMGRNLNPEATILNANLIVKSEDFIMRNMTLCSKKSGKNIIVSNKSQLELQNVNIYVNNESNIEFRDSNVKMNHVKVEPSNVQTQNNFSLRLHNSTLNSSFLDVFSISLNESSMDIERMRISSEIH